MTLQPIVLIVDDEKHTRDGLRRLLENDYDVYVAADIAGAMDVLDRVPRLRDIGAHFKQALRNKLIEHKQYVTTRGEDMPEIRDWRWGQLGPRTVRVTSTEADNV